MGLEKFKGELCLLWSAKFLIFFVQTNQVGLVLQDIYQDGILSWFLQLDERGPVGKTEEGAGEIQDRFQACPILDGPVVSIFSLWKSLVFYVFVGFTNSLTSNSRSATN